MDRTLELWSRWIADQPTKTIEDLLRIGRDEIQRRREAQAATKATQDAIDRRLKTQGDDTLPRIG